MLLLYHHICVFAVINVGFKQEEYRVSENDGILSVTYGILFPSDLSLIDPNLIILVIPSIVDGSAIRKDPHRSKSMQLYFFFLQKIRISL